MLLPHSARRNQQHFWIQHDCKILKFCLHVKNYVHAAWFHKNCVYCPCRIWCFPLSSSTCCYKLAIRPRQKWFYRFISATTSDCRKFWHIVRSGRIRLIWQVYLTSEWRYSAWMCYCNRSTNEPRLCHRCVTQIPLTHHSTLTIYHDWCLHHTCKWAHCVHARYNKMY